MAPARTGQTAMPLWRLFSSTRGISLLNPSTLFNAFCLYPHSPHNSHLPRSLVSFVICPPTNSSVLLHLHPLPSVLCRLPCTPLKRQARKTHKRQSSMCISVSLKQPSRASCWSLLSIILSLFAMPSSPHPSSFAFRRFFV